MFVQGSSVTGFVIGHFIQIADGASKTTGTPVCKRIIDGTAGTCENAASYNSTLGAWEIDLSGNDMAGFMIGLSFTLADCLPISYNIKTVSAEWAGANAIASAVWDETLEIDVHDQENSAGMRLRSLRSAVHGQVSDSSATTTVFETDLSIINDFTNWVIVFTSGALIGQARVIKTYTLVEVYPTFIGVVTVNEAFSEAPAQDDSFDVVWWNLPQTADAVWDESTSGHATAGTTGKALTDTLEDTAVIGTPAGASIAADLAAIEGQTDDIGVAGAGLTAIPAPAAGVIVASGGIVASSINTGAITAAAIADGAIDAATFAAGAITASAIADAAIDAATFASGAITADAIAANAIGASELATDAVNEIAAAVAASLGSVDSVTIVTTVSGATATVYQYDTWEAAFTLSGSPGLTSYENVIFSVKRNAGKLDAESILYVDTTTGLLYAGEAAATAANKGSLTINSATQFTVYVDREEVRDKIAAGFAATHTWTLKGISTGSTPDEAITIATGSWIIAPGWIRSIT